MPKGYHHLTYEQRCQIFTLLKRNLSNREIAKFLKISSRTVDREIIRNEGKRGYRFKQAHGKATNRRTRASSKPHKMTNEFKLLIETLLRKEQWSPEQISGRLKLECRMTISYESIYKHIWENKKMVAICTSNYDDLAKNIISGRAKMLDGDSFLIVLIYLKDPQL